MEEESKKWMTIVWNGVIAVLLLVAMVHILSTTESKLYNPDEHVATIMADRDLISEAPLPIKANIACSYLVRTGTFGEGITMFGMKCDYTKQSKISGGAKVVSQCTCSYMNPDSKANTTVNVFENNNMTIEAYNVSGDKVF